MGACYNFCMNYSTILLAAGRGSRTNLDYNKVFYHLDTDRTVLDASLALFLDDEECRQIVLVCAPYELDYVQSNYSKDPRICFVAGGDTRQQSVCNGLDAVKEDYVFIHDAARPFLKPYSIYELKKTLEIEDACLLMVPSVDTVKLVEGGYVAQTLCRDQVYRAQTPQCFKTSLIQKCHEKAKNAGKLATDDAQLVEWYGKIPVRVVYGDEENIKITLPSDLIHD